MHLQAVAQLETPREIRAAHIQRAHATVFEPLDFETHLPPSLLREADHLSTVFTLLQAKPKNKAKRNAVPELVGRDRILLGDIFLRYNLRTSLGNLDYMYRATFMRTAVDVGVGSVHLAAEAFDACAEVWTGQPLLNNIGFLRALVYCWKAAEGDRWPRLEEDARALCTECTDQALERANRLVPAPPPELVASIRSMRRQGVAQILQGAAGEETKQPQLRHLPRRPLESPETAPSVPDEDEPGLGQSDGLRARIILEQSWVFRVLQRHRRQRLSPPTSPAHDATPADSRFAAAGVVLRHAEGDSKEHCADKALAEWREQHKRMSSPTHAQRTHDFGLTKQQDHVQKLLKQLERQAAWRETDPLTTVHIGPPPTTTKPWWSERWWLKLRIDDALLEPELLGTLLDYEPALWALYERYAVQRPLDPRNASARFYVTKPARDQPERRGGEGMTAGDWHAFCRDFCLRGPMRSVNICRDGIFADIVTRATPSRVDFDGFLEGVGRLVAWYCLVQGNSVQQRFSGPHLGLWAVCWLRQKIMELCPQLDLWGVRRSVRADVWEHFPDLL